MKLSELSIRRPVFATVMSLLGLLLFLVMKRDLHGLDPKPVAAQRSLTILPSKNI